jgi:hypothetical protein
MRFSTMVATMSDIDADEPAHSYASTTCASPSELPSENW